MRACGMHMAREPACPHAAGDRGWQISGAMPWPGRHRCRPHATAQGRAPSRAGSSPRALQALPAPAAGCGSWWFRQTAAVWRDTRGALRAHGFPYGKRDGVCSSIFGSIVTISAKVSHQPQIPGSASPLCIPVTNTGMSLGMALVISTSSGMRAPEERCHHLRPSCSKEAGDTLVLKSGSRCCLQSGPFPLRSGRAVQTASAQPRGNQPALPKALVGAPVWVEVPRVGGSPGWVLTPPPTLPSPQPPPCRPTSGGAWARRSPTAATR